MLVFGHWSSKTQCSGNNWFCCFIDLKNSYLELKMHFMMDAVSLDDAPERVLGSGLNSWTTVYFYCPEDNHYLNQQSACYHHHDYALNGLFSHCTACSVFKMCCNECSLVCTQTEDINSFRRQWCFNMKTRLWELFKSLSLFSLKPLARQVCLQTYSWCSQPWAQYHCKNQNSTRMMQHLDQTTVDLQNVRQH